MIDEIPHRPRCYRCMRPGSLCLCGDLTSVPTRTEVVILQHPQERKHPFGTARLVGLCLPRARIHVAHGGLAGNLLCPLELPPDAALLYPHADAADLTEVAAVSPPSTLLVLDGTWAHAKRLYAENPWLQRIRHVRLHPKAESRYRIRKEPRPDYISTLEAVVEALQILEPDTPGLQGLVTAFDRMIDRQIAQIDAAPRHHRRRKERQGPSRSLPAMLDDEDLVVAYAETSLPGGDVAAHRELVQWSAARVTTGETFECLIRPTGSWPSPHHLGYMRITEAEVAAGVSLTQAQASFQQWAGSAPVAVWTQSSLDWGGAILVPGAPTCVLKTAYTNLRNHAAGVLEEVLRREGLQSAPNGCRGRARERLGSALAVARWLRSMRTELVAAAGTGGGACT